MLPTTLFTHYSRRGSSLVDWWFSPLISSFSYFIWFFSKQKKKKKKVSHSVFALFPRFLQKKRIPALNYLLLSLSLVEIGFLFQLFFFSLFNYLNFFLTLKWLSTIFSHATIFKRVRVSFCFLKKKQQFNLISENSCLLKFHLFWLEWFHDFFCCFHIVASCI